jgi:hypothetical protein
MFGNKNTIRKYIYLYWSPGRCLYELGNECRVPQKLGGLLTVWYSLMYRGTHFRGVNYNIYYHIPAVCCCFILWANVISTRSNNRYMGLKWKLYYFILVDKVSWGCECYDQQLISWNNELSCYLTWTSYDLHRCNTKTGDSSEATEPIKLRRITYWKITVLISYRNISYTCRLRIQNFSCCFVLVWNLVTRPETSMLSRLWVTIDGVWIGYCIY